MNDKNRKTIKCKLRNLDLNTYNNILDKCKVTKNLYNQSLFIIRQYFFKMGEYLNYNDMDNIMKDMRNTEGDTNYRLIKAQSAQQLLRKLDKNFKSFFNANKDYKENKHKYTGKPSIPKYIKLDKNKKEILYYNLIYSINNSVIKGNKIQLEKGILIKLPKALKDKKIQQIEIIPKNNHLIAYFVYKDIEDYIQIEPNDNKMGIDLGVNNLAACVTNLNKRPFIINGKPLKSINQFLNKRKAKKQSILKKRNNQYVSKSIIKLQDKAENKMNDYIHKAANKIVSYCVKNKISQVVIGGVTEGMTNIAQKSSKKKNQNFVQIKLGQYASFIRSMLERHGIKVKTQEESYTSKCSSIDYEKICKHIKYLGRRIHRGLFRTLYGRLLNADINGAFNILRKAFPNIKLSIDGIEALFRPYKLAI